MISINDKKRCCGCSACASICPQKCIMMKRDCEGFLYPWVDKNNCINCNKCEKVCPILHQNINLNESRASFIVQNRNNTILKESTSGGFFSLLAEYVLDHEGVVFGARYDSSFYVKHDCIEKKADVDMFRNSKYCQSDINNTYLKCLKYIMDGRLVCFSGTPCQIAGLKFFLGKDYENLITVDVVCRGVPSPLVFEKYVEWRKKDGAIDNIKFRDKHYGYYSSTMSIYYKNGKVKRNDVKNDPFLKLFFDNMCCRPSCYQCCFKTKKRMSDFTMFDSWHAQMFAKIFNTKGATSLIIRSEKGNLIFKKIEKNFIVKEVPFEDIYKFDGEMMTQCIDINPQREGLFKAIQDGEDFAQINKEYNKKSGKEIIKLFFKKIMYKNGLFNYYMMKRFLKDKDKNINAGE